MKKSRTTKMLFAASTLIAALFFGLGIFFSIFERNTMVHPSFFLAVGIFVIITTLGLSAMREGYERKKTQETYPIPLRNYILLPFTECCFFCALAFIFWEITHCHLHTRIFSSIAQWAPLGMLLYAVLPPAKKHLGRKLTFFAIFVIMFLHVALFGRENIQLEGFFFAFATGLSGAAFLHYAISKIFGPLVLNRVWCGWGCWTMMVLDLLPYKTSRGRLKGWGWIRLAHFIISLAAVLFFWNRYKTSITAEGLILVGLWWFLIGNILYYLSGVFLAYLLKDNRAFCKYLCPITVFLKPASVFALLRIRATTDECAHCDLCSRACPMDINVHEYVKTKERVLSTECTLCLICIDACPAKKLEVSVGWEKGGKERLNTLTANLPAPRPNR